MNDPTSQSRLPRDDGAQENFGLGDIIRDWLRGLGRGRNGDSSLRESLEGVIEEHENSEASIKPEERLMLMNILSFGDKRVDDVMIPRADITAIEANIGFEELIEAFRTASHTRLPVYRETLDDIVGVIHVKDLLKYWKRTGGINPAKIARRPLFVPPSMPVLDLLLQMRTSRRHLAIVVDEYGGTDGLVTIEDLVEEIVGDIQDEHDTDEEPMIVELDDGAYDVDARAELEDFEALVGFDLLPEEDDEEIDTVGGMVFSLIGRVPQRGEVVAHPCGLEIEVVDADPRRIKRLLVRKTAPLESAEA